MTVISDTVRALVLAYRGVPLPIGCDRAARVLAAVVAPNRPYLGWAAHSPPGGCRGPSLHIYFSDDLDETFAFEEIEAPRGYRGADIVVPALSGVVWGLPTTGASALAAACTQCGLAQVVVVR